MNIRARQDGTTIIFDLEGQVDFESTMELQQRAKMVTKSQVEPRVVINMRSLRFVGSTAINQFVQVLKEFSTPFGKPRLCEVSSEFERLIRAFQSNRKPFEIFESESQARENFILQPEKITKRRVKKNKDA